ncbi:acyl-CoA dehydrogenase family protein [Salinibacterium sp. SYSU T00001]|uniref:acyl-CoA dehydrogenase family protein n=1 Tax=Homoserinimonas sedimenticola TaxID=2986805 RepID=UPI0022356E7F|nr:acyl-CoA dehydrogenase family protein [Salinibacterium sedimenticola]MCW4386384.1 acyl-CoA dehydrogenase family protein [Salinibacterium sedimenticola]
MTDTTVTPTRELARNYYTGTASAEELERWSAIAQAAADELAVDALERDRANVDPRRELARLKELGLVNLLHPAEFGGGGAHWETAFKVVRILSRVDSSVAQVLAYHYINSSNIGFQAPASVQADWFRRTVEGDWVWGDSVNPVDPDVALVREGDHYVLRGFKRFSTGSTAGEVLLVSAVIEGGELDGDAVLLVLESGREGIEYAGDWDFLGQRLSASGSVRFNDVRVDDGDLLAVQTLEPFANLITPGIQLFFGNIYLGLAEGALARGRELTLARRNSWFLSQAETYARDPFVQRLYGEFDSQAAAVEALADRVGRQFDEVVGLGTAAQPKHRGAIEIAVARLKVVSSELGTDLTNRIFEATGSSSAKSSIGFDLYWRNIRTHSLHDPVDYKKLEVGAHYLLGELQPISLYT